MAVVRVAAWHCRAVLGPIHNLQADCAIAELRVLSHSAGDSLIWVSGNWYGVTFLVSGVAIGILCQIFGVGLTYPLLVSDIWCPSAFL